MKVEERRRTAFSLDFVPGRSEFVELHVFEERFVAFERVFVKPGYTPAVIVHFQYAGGKRSFNAVPPAE
jgi:hypothetical protein